MQLKEVNKGNLVLMSRTIEGHGCGRCSSLPQCGGVLWLRTASEGKGGRESGVVS